MEVPGGVVPGTSFAQAVPPTLAKWHTRGIQDICQVAYKRHSRHLSSGMQEAFKWHTSASSESLIRESCVCKGEGTGGEVFANVVSMW